MPRLLMFCACEIVVIGENQSPTLVNLLNEVKFNATPEVMSVEDAAVPFKWNIFAQWEFSVEERESKWEQRLQFVKESGEPTKLDHVAEIIIEKDKALHRMVANLTFFPILPAGNYRIILSIRRIQQNEEWNDMGDYPMVIRYA